MENFSDLMFEAFDDTLKLVLGESISELIYSLAERQPSLKLKEPNKNIDSIISYLEKLIGKEGAQIIQTMSVKRLCYKIRHEYEEVEAHFLFLEELYEMKFKLLAPLLTKKKSANN
jgi:hypothetical protein